MLFSLVSFTKGYATIDHETKGEGGVTQALTRKVGSAFLFTFYSFALQIFIFLIFLSIYELI